MSSHMGIQAMKVFKNQSTYSAGICILGTRGLKDDDFRSFADNRTRNLWY